MFSHPSERSVSRGGSICESQDDSTDGAPGGLLAADCSGRTGRPSCKTCTGRRYTGPKMEKWIQGKLLWGLYFWFRRGGNSPSPPHLYLFFVDRHLFWMSRCSFIPPLRCSKRFQSLSSTRRSWRPPRCTWKVNEFCENARCASSCWFRELSNVKKTFILFIVYRCAVAS